MAMNELAERDAMRQEAAKMEARAMEAELAVRNCQIDELHAQSEELGSELESIRGMIEHAKCEALRLDSEANDATFAKAEGVRQERVREERASTTEMLELLTLRAEEVDAMLQEITAHRAQRLEEAACVASRLATLRQDA
jgi:hypothetical protein